MWWYLLVEIGSAAGLLDARLLGLGQLADVAVHGVLSGRRRSAHQSGGLASEVCCCDVVQRPGGCTYEDNCDLGRHVVQLCWSPCLERCVSRSLFPSLLSGSLVLSRLWVGVYWKKKKKSASDLCQQLPNDFRSRSQFPQGRSPCYITCQTDAMAAPMQASTDGGEAKWMAPASGWNVRANRCSPPRHRAGSGATSTRPGTGSSRWMDLDAKSARRIGWYHITSGPAPGSGMRQWLASGVPQ